MNINWSVQLTINNLCVLFILNIQSIVKKHKISIRFCILRQHIFLILVTNVASCAVFQQFPLSGEEKTHKLYLKKSTEISLFAAMKKGEDIPKQYKTHSVHVKGGENRSVPKRCTLNVFHWAVNLKAEIRQIRAAKSTKFLTF